MSVKLSVVIVHYRTPDLLRACLEALCAHAPDAEILVVDNDGSAADVCAMFPAVRYLPQAENRWFCGGNNLGIDAAQGDYVLLLNPDTVIQPDGLDTLVAFMDAHPDYHGATLQLRYPDGNIQRTCSRVPTYEYLLLNHTLLGLILRGRTAVVDAHHWYADWLRDSDRDVEVLPGSCLLMRRADLRLDDRLKLYFPEDDLARRFAGERFRYLSSSFITHHEKAATQSWLATQVYYRDLLIYT
ncbi:MAG: glycosyltransferase, partial [Anaerolineae bacterium]|nr:glycosyltransferase [Anaerolineae bacterium]